MTGFVKLDCAMLDSTVYIDRDVRDVFITSLLMAGPWELTEPTEAIEVDSLKPSGFVVPPGWYGLVQASGPGIVDRAKMPRELGMAALKTLCSPEPESRSSDFEGRRMARINGGYLVLNYAKYRERDYTGAERAKRYRDARKAGQLVTPSRRDVTASHRDVTHAEAEAEADRNQEGSAYTELEVRKVLTLDGEPYKPATEDEAIRQVWLYYVAAMQKPRAVLDEKRYRLIRARLVDGWTPQQLMTAISGCASDAWSQGRNDRGKPFNELGLILRDAEHVERYIELAGSPSKPRSKAEQRTARNMDAAREFLRRTDPEGSA